MRVRAFLKPAEVHGDDSRIRVTYDEKSLFHARQITRLFNELAQAVLKTFGPVELEIVTPEGVYTQQPTGPLETLSSPSAPPPRRNVPLSQNQWGSAVIQRSTMQMRAFLKPAQFHVEPGYVRITFDEKEVFRGRQVTQKFDQLAQVVRQVCGPVTLELLTPDGSRKETLEADLSKLPRKEQGGHNTVTPELNFAVIDLEEPGLSGSDTSRPPPSLPNRSIQIAPPPFTHNLVAPARPEPVFPHCHDSSGRLPAEHNSLVDTSRTSSLPAKQGPLPILEGPQHDPLAVIPNLLRNMRRYLVATLDVRRQQPKVSGSNMVPEVPHHLEGLGQPFRAPREPMPALAEAESLATAPTMPTLPWITATSSGTSSEAKALKRQTGRQQGRWEQLHSHHAYIGSFLEEARRRVNETRKNAQPVPLQSYWTNYHVLNQAQAAWYFFWRARFRAGEALETDLSYLFLHAYEVIHGVGFPHPEAAFQHLRRLWHRYRESHPRLDDYLPSWLTDFVHYYELGEAEKQAWLEEAKAYGRSDLTVDHGEDRANLLIQHWLEGDDRTHVPQEMFRHLITYTPNTNKFYRDAKDQATLDALFDRAITLIDEFYRETTGTSVFERLGPKTATQINRRAFAGAVFEGPPFSYTIGTVPRYPQDGKLSKLLTQGVRHAENLARKQAGTKFLLRDIDLSEDLKAYLDAHLLPQQQAPQATLPAPQRLATGVQLDLSRLAILQRESEEIRERLLEEGLPGESSAAAAPLSPRPPADQPETALDSPGSALTTTPFLVDTPRSRPAHLDTLATALGTMSPPAQDLLRQLHDQDWEMSERDVQLPLGTFVSTLVDEVNEAAESTLGDVLLQQEGGLLIAVEDYREELNFLLYPQEEPLTAPAKRLEGPWQDLAEVLPLLHLEILARLLQSDLSLVELEAFTAARHALASAVLEDLNTHALDTLGDILIDPYGDPLTVEVAYRDDVRRVLQVRSLTLPE